jgi:exoribonuclease R
MAFRNYSEDKDYKLGQRVDVQIARVDMERQLVDFVLIEEQA